MAELCAMGTALEAVALQERVDAFIGSSCSNEVVGGSHRIGESAAELFPVPDTSDSVGAR
jgi:hypothetical protein